MHDALKFALIAACALTPLEAGAQTANNLAALKGLAPFAALPNSPAGQAALAANFAVTGGIQTGALRRPSLLPFAEQQQQALRDVFITGGDLAELADGLGTTLGGAYVARAHYLDREHFTSVSPAVADVIAYAEMTSAVDSNSAKYFFANATTDGKTPISDQAAAILAEEPWRHRRLRRRLRQAARRPRRRPLRRLAAVPDRAELRRDRRARLFQRSLRQCRLQPRPGDEPRRQSLVSERPHHLRLYRRPAAGAADARALPRDDRARRRIRRGPHRRRRALRDRRAGRSDTGDLRRRPSARQRSRLCRPDAEDTRRRSPTFPPR